MKKITIALFILLGSFSMASAELGINIGVSAQAGLFEGKASEGSTDTLVRQTSTQQEALVGTVSYFIEKDLAFLPGFLGGIGSRIHIGYDNLGHDIDFGTASNIADNSDRASTGTGEISFANKVSAEITGWDTTYATLNITDWLYVKSGSINIDVKTTENLASGGSYGDTALDGTMYGLGIHKESEGGFFWRLEYNDYSIDGVTLVNQGATSSRSVKLNGVDGTTSKLSVGKAF